jgi:hypothetical protein
MTLGTNCGKCGAPNDPLMVNCIYCKAQLPETDKSKISNEELLANAAEWVGKSSMIAMSLPPQPGVKVGLLTDTTIRNEQICALAERYLTILAVRAEGSPVVANQLRILESRLKENRKLPRKKFLTIMGVLLLIITILMSLLFFFEDSDDKPLIAIETELNQALDRSDLDRAEILLIKLNYSGYKIYKAKAWSNKHDQYRLEIDRRRKLKGK